MKHDLEDRASAMQIVSAAGMSDRPAFYSGRGAVTCDLNDTILEQIYQGIRKGRGEEPAEEFVKMVAYIPELNATDFLLTLYALEDHGWKWDRNLFGNDRGICLDGKTEAETFAIGFATIGSTLNRLNRGSMDQTEGIRGPFLRRHGVQPARAAYGQYSDS